MSLLDEYNTWLCETMWWDEENIRWPSAYEEAVSQCE